MARGLLRYGSMERIADKAGRSTPVWAETSDLPAPARLDGNQQADVCVVGAGIAGLSTAYMLSRSGKSVVVLDDGPIGGGNTGRTTAHLSNAIDDRYVEVERLHGAEGARIAAESHTEAIDTIEAVVGREAIDCDFRRVDGYLFLAPEHSPELLDRELDAAHRAGLAGVERLERAPVEGFESGPCLRFPRQGQFHPLRYLAGLARAIAGSGGRIYTGAHVGEVRGGDRPLVRTDDGFEIRASAIVVATNTPVNDRVAVHTKQAGYLSYAIAAVVDRGAITPVLLWDTGDPYHYVRVQPSPDHDLLIVGGEDHKVGQADDFDERYLRLENWTRARFRGVGRIEYRWSGEVFETVDYLAFIGRNPLDSPNVYIATGDSGMGMTHGTIAGILLSELISGNDAHPWAGLYDPGRVRLRAAGEFARENLNAVAHYGQWFSGGEVESADDIPPGEGAVLRRGAGKIAVYRDLAGGLQCLSAMCTHLACVVTWNSSEQTWDCPCHGSRFDPYGAVINGPAVRPLVPVEEPEEQLMPPEPKHA
jgi:glycine/D-amino acid oxidase-like deaminating enzyme/nitrite reductase/ring-hydroxylating ferredoxin subunit